jgi:two-component system chemotaxis response regulator CheB
MATQRVKGEGAEKAVIGEKEGPEGTPPGIPSIFSCPDCGGVLFEQEGGHRYACRVGHAYAPESLLSHESDRVEEALWAGLRALEESAVLARRLAKRARERMSARSAQGFDERAADAEARARVLRRLLQGTLAAAPPRRQPAPRARARRKR